LKPRTFTCIAVVPVANRIVADLSPKPSKSASVLLVTIWELGEAAGPLFVAPLSELFGRAPLFHFCNGLFVFATVLAALSTSVPLFISARALTGLAVAGNVLNPAIVGDMFVSDQRGAAMSLIMLAPLLGGATGPAIAGAIAEKAGWRVVVWMSAGLAAVCQVLFLLFFRETYDVQILKKRAAKLRAETGNQELRTIWDNSGRSGRQLLVESILRPMIILGGSTILQLISLFGSVAFAYFYVMSTTLPDILQDVYGLSPTQVGLSFMSFSVGSTFSVFICKYLLDGIYIMLRRRNKDQGQPEYRLPMVIFGGFALPLTLVFYGWVADKKLPFPLPLVATGLIGFVLIYSYIPLMTYVVDAFGRYSASAMTGLIVMRCLMGTFLPLIVEPLVEAYGYGWGLSVIGGISLLLAPIPVLIYKYGHRWRQYSEYTRDE
jgi:MFS family permease